MDPAVTKVTLFRVILSDAVRAEERVLVCIKNITHAKPLARFLHIGLIIGSVCGAHIFPEESVWEREGLVRPVSCVLFQHSVKVCVVVDETIDGSGANLVVEAC